MSGHKENGRRPALSLLGVELAGTAAAERIIKLPLAVIRPNPYQPRKEFPPESIAELAANIKQHGQQQPIVVRLLKSPAAPGGPDAGPAYELMAGERRLRAHEYAGLPTIDAVVREIRDNKMLILALIENLQREDLKVLDAAEAFCKYRDEHVGGSTEEAIKAVNIKRATGYVYAKIGDADARYKGVIAKNALGFEASRFLLSMTDKIRKTVSDEKFAEYENEILLERPAGRNLSFEELRRIHEKWCPKPEKGSETDESANDSSLKTRKAQEPVGECWKDERFLHLQLKVPTDPKLVRAQRGPAVRAIEYFLRQLGAKNISVEF